ncbi:MAG: hypothetical protein LBF28_00185 [Rickettsiales bacterium]|nr:hypothetical protein [Rickettsiales bacterium]
MECGGCAEVENGYYSPSNDNNKYPCESSGLTNGSSNVGVTSAKGSSSVTSCYIPVGSTVADTTGSYTFDSNCYYSN